MKRFTLLSLTVLLVLPLISSAAVIEHQAAYTLPRAITIHDNLYTAGENVIISGTVVGDLIALGSSFISTGTLSSDALVVAGTIELQSPISGDARLLGAHVTVSQNVGGDLVVAGGTVTVLPDVLISNDTLIAGGEVAFEGHAKRSLKIRAGSATINGIIDGSVTFKGGELTIGPRAVIEGTVTAESGTAVVVKEGALIKGGTKFDTTSYEGEKGFAEAIFGIVFLAKLLILLVSTLVLLPLFRSQVREVARFSLFSFGKSFLIGFGIFIATPILIGLLVFSVVGVLLGIILLFLYLLLLMGACIVSGIIFGTIIYSLYRKQKEVPEHLSWKIAVPGVLLLLLVGLIPFFGPLIETVFFFVSLGALGTLSYQSFRNSRKFTGV